MRHRPRPARPVDPGLVQRLQRAVLAAAQATSMDPNDILKGDIVELEDVVRRATSSTDPADADYTKRLFPAHYRERAARFK